MVFAEGDVVWHGATITGLQPNTDYIFSVYAENSRPKDSGPRRSSVVKLTARTTGMRHNIMVSMFWMFNFLYSSHGVPMCQECHYYRIASRCKYYRFRAGNPVFVHLPALQLKCPAFVAYFALIVQCNYLYCFVCVAYLEFKAASSRAETSPE